MLLSLLALVACSDDDDDNRVVSPVQTAKHFTGAELELTFSGNKAVGKDILFTPDANDATLATLTFLGERFDVEAAMNNGSRNEEPAGFSTSSVFAGEGEVTLPISMVIEGDKGTFEGSSESKYYTYDYRGSVLENILTVEISNVALKNKKFAGTEWNLEPIVKNDWGMVESIPMKFEWESEKKLAIELFGTTTEYSMSQIMALVMSIGIVPGEDGKKITIPEIVSSMLQSVKFENDGNLAASYVDMKTKQPKTSPKGLAQYVVVDDSKMKLVLNPFAIAADAKKEPAADDNAEANPMGEMMKALTPEILKALNADDKLTNGVDINYIVEGDKMTAFVDETLFLPVLKMFAPMLQNPDLINTIVEAIKQNPDMAAMAPMIESVLKQFPEVVNTTTKMEVGLKFVKK